MDRSKIRMWEVESDGATHWFVSDSLTGVKMLHFTHLAELESGTLEEITEEVVSAAYKELPLDKALGYTFEDGTKVILRTRDYLELLSHRHGFFATTER